MEGRGPLQTMRCSDYPLTELIVLNHRCLFPGTRVVEGLVCDKIILIATKTEEIRKQLLDVSEGIWLGISQFESRNGAVGLT
jgi:hypothetical protein